LLSFSPEPNALPPLRRDLPRPVPLPACRDRRSCGLWGGL